jgi:hypothetical protein
MRATAAAITTIAGLLSFAALPASAEMGPCRPDKFNGLICSAGPGAARVIDDTLSPDNRFAFGWRTPNGDPTRQPTEAIEFLLLRLSDGAILAESTTNYWDTGEAHVNRLMEVASWSPDGRLVARAFQEPFDTGNFEPFALGGNDALIGTLDLRKIVEAGLRARWKLARRFEDFSFYVTPGKNVAIRKTGRMRFTVMMWVPKDGPEEYFDVRLQIARDKGGARAHHINQEGA